MRAALALSWRQGRFLFESIPDLIPYGYLSDVELELWNRYAETMRHGNRR